MSQSELRRIAIASARAAGIEPGDENTEEDILRAYGGLTETTRRDHNSWVEALRNIKSARLEGTYRMQITASGSAEQINHLLSITKLDIKHWKLLEATCKVQADEASVLMFNRMIDACKYQGFDPVATMTKIINYWLAGSRVAAEERYQLTFSGGNGEERWDYSNKMPCNDDIYFLILVFLNRGAVIGKILKKSSKEFIAVLRMLCAKYHVNITETGRGRRTEALSPEIITLPRIAAAFPAITCDLYHLGYGRSLANLSSFPENVPRVLFSPMFASVVSRKVIAEGGLRSNIHPQIIWHSILVDNVLHQRDRGTPLDLIWTYHLAAFNSIVMHENERHAICEKWGVVVNNKFTQVITDLRQAAKDAIRRMRPHERVEELLNEMDAIF